MKLVQAYIAAVLFNQNKKKPDGEEMAIYTPSKRNVYILP